LAVGCADNEQARADIRRLFHISSLTHCADRIANGTELVRG
jgi:hypothetical protein